MLAPFYAGALTDNHSFRIMADVVAFVLIAFSLIYLVFGTGFSAFSETKLNYRNKNRLTIKTTKEDDDFTLQETFSPVPNRLDDMPGLRKSGNGSFELKMDNFTPETTKQTEATTEKTDAPNSNDSSEHLKLNK